jgi:hypothetical protein
MPSPFAFVCSERIGLEAVYFWIFQPNYSFAASNVVILNPLGQTPYGLGDMRVYKVAFELGFLKTGFCLEFANPN